MMSKKKKKSKKHIDFEPTSASLDSHSTRGSSVSSEIMNQRFSGQLSKYTNVVKGWQYRWFLLDPHTGMLHYYLVRLMRYIDTIYRFASSMTEPSRRST